MTTETQDQKFTTCDVETGVGKVTVIAEPTETPGLFVTPDLMGGEFTGTFAITHGPSGLRIPVGWDGDDLDQVRAIATALGTTPVDWTADQASVSAQISEHSDAVTAARRDAKYPIVVAEDVEKLGGYPTSEEQATVDAIAKHVTVGLQHECRDRWDFVGRDDDDGRKLHRFALAAIVAEWALVHVLREFAAVDQQAADATAREVWNVWEDGGSIDEAVWGWAREYRLPELPEKDEPATETSAVSTITTTEVL